jgi:hypothetical protein
MSERAWPTKGDLIEVEWIDSASTNGWQEGDPNDADDGGLVVCRSAGYLWGKDRRAVRIVQSQSTHGSTAEMIAIPRSCVRSITRLSRKPKD